MENEDGFFSSQAHAKCILAGEHAVLHGCPAIILPVHQKKIKLTYQETNHSLSIKNLSSNNFDVTALFLNSIEYASKVLQRDFHKEILGTFTFKNNIEIGAGIGFSSALCVVISRWLIWRGWLQAEDLFEFSRKLENMYHGKSSGMDVAGAISEQIIAFMMSGEIYEIHPLWKPKFYLSYSGVKKNTQMAVDKVSELGRTNPTLSHSIDEQMKNSALLIEEALNINEGGLDKLVIAFEMAKHCFVKWGLITPVLQQHLDQLHNLGALTAKPTGAGLGGHVVSLWNEAPPPGYGLELIEICQEK